MFTEEIKKISRKKCIYKELEYQDATEWIVACPEPSYPAPLLATLLSLFLTHLSK